MTEHSRSASGRISSTPTAVGLSVQLAIARLEKQRIDPAPLLQRCRLNAADLAEKRRISVLAQIKLLQEASKASGDEWLGINLAENFDLRQLGMLYYVAASSHTLGEAFRRLERYARVGNEALVIQIGNSEFCRIGLTYSGVPRHLDRQQIEMFARVLVRLCRQLLARNVAPRSAQFVHHRTGDLRPIIAALGCQVTFDAYSDEVWFDKDIVNEPLVSQDPYLNELMCKACEEALESRGYTTSAFRTKVENTVAPLLPHAEADIKAVSKRLGLSERTFARRLASEGLRFKTILDDMRRSLAAQYLAEPDIQISQIGWLLGFQQPSAFSHACRKWFGCSPSDYRRRHVS